MRSPFVNNYNYTLGFGIDYVLLQPKEMVRQNMYELINPFVPWSHAHQSVDVWMPQFYSFVENRRIYYR